MQLKLLSILLHVSVSIGILIASLCQILFRLVQIIRLALYVLTLIVSNGIRECLSKCLCIAISCYLRDNITVNCIGKCLSEIYICSRAALTAVHFQVTLTRTGYLYHLNVVASLDLGKCGGAWCHCYINISGKHRADLRIIIDVEYGNAVHTRCTVPVILICFQLIFLLRYILLAYKRTGADRCIVIVARINRCIYDDAHRLGQVVRECAVRLCRLEDDIFAIYFYACKLQVFATAVLSSGTLNGLLYGFRCHVVAI